MKQRKHHLPEMKLKVVLEALKEELTVGEIAAKYEVHPNMISRWKQEFLEKAPDVFKRGKSDAGRELKDEQAHTARLERKVGQLTCEVDWLKKNLKKSLDTGQRRRIVEKTEPDISVKRQAELLDVSRSGAYRTEPAPRPVDPAELILRNLIDRIHTDNPTWGYRMITGLLKVEHGLNVNRKRVRRIMRDMGIYAIHPKPNLSKRRHAAHVRPYLLRNLPITEPDQVWGVDITYVPLQKGFMYLFVIIDWHSRFVVDYELSGTQDKTFVQTCLERALSGGRKPKIINSDQGGHFTNPDYIELLEESGVKISMDGKGQCLDNARTERFFRTLKYDTVYIQEVDTPRELRRMLDEHIDRYNHYRPHSSLCGKRPSEIYGSVAKQRAA